VAVLLGRNLGAQVLAVGATIVLARLLSPKDYGAFAVASVIQQSAIIVVNFGLPAALVRRPSAPSIEELQSVSGYVLAMGTAVAAAALAIAFVILPLLGASSEVADLAAIACLSLPILGVQTAPIVLLSRSLDFRRVVVIEISDAIAFYSFAVIAAVAGLGAFSLAGAVPVAAIVGMIMAFRVRPWERGFRIHREHIRRLAPFGMRVGVFQAAAITRELGFVALLAGLGGQALAGFYGMALRLFAPPYAAMAAIERVGLAAFTKVESGANRARQAARAAGVAMLAVGLPMALVAGAADPLVSLLFGSRWLPAADIAVVASAGVLLFSGAGTVLVSHAFSEGDARSPLIGILSQIVVLLGLALILVPGDPQIGTGVALGAGFAAFALVIWLRAPREARSSGAAIIGGLLVAAGAAACGHAAAATVGTGAVAVGVSVAVTATVWAVLAVLLARPSLKLLISLIRRHLIARSSRAGVEGLGAARG